MQLQRMLIYCLCNSLLESILANKRVNVKEIKLTLFGGLPAGATTAWVLGHVECPNYFGNLLLPEERLFTNIQLVPEFFRGAPKGGSVFDTPTIPLRLNN